MVLRVAQHVVSGGEHGGRHRGDGLHRPRRRLRRRNRARSYPFAPSDRRPRPEMSTGLSHGALLRRRVERCLPALASWRGHSPKRARGPRGPRDNHGCARDVGSNSLAGFAHQTMLDLGAGTAPCQFPTSRVDPTGRWSLVRKGGGLVDAPLRRGDNKLVDAPDRRVVGAKDKSPF
jgi:hypothetical protein